jgi:hypothetical protein
MRTLVFAAAALVSGCLAESAGGRAIQHPMANAANATVCAGESQTGSSINRTVCREPPSPDDKAESARFHDTLQTRPLRGPSYATDTPGLRVYR